MTTQELVERCSTKDEVAFNEFVRRYRNLVTRCVHYKLNKLGSKLCRSDVDDISQEVFLSIWQDNKLRKLRDVSCLEAWLAMVTINRTSNYCRRRWKVERVTTSLNTKLSNDASTTLEDIIPSGQFNTLRDIETIEAMSILSERIEKLRTAEKTALEMNIYDGKRQFEIADLMGIPNNTVATLIRRAKCKVTKGMKEIYI